jgi:hypothetical protein
MSASLRQVFSNSCKRKLKENTQEVDRERIDPDMDEKRHGLKAVFRGMSAETRSQIVLWLRIQAGVPYYEANALIQHALASRVVVRDNIIKTIRRTRQYNLAILLGCMLLTSVAAISRAKKSATATSAGPSGPSARTTDRADRPLLAHRQFRSTTPHSRREGCSNC